MKPKTEAIEIVDLDAQLRESTGRALAAAVAARRAGEPLPEPEPDPVLEAYVDAMIAAAETEAKS